MLFLAASGVDDRGTLPKLGLLVSELNTHLAQEQRN